MVSFDVESLYTNIPVTDALLVIKDLLNDNTTLQDRTNLLPDQILELLEFLLRTTFFIFNGEFHQQTDGVAMGGPASFIVVEIYMISIEISAITTADTPLRIWERHVDGVFFILRRCNLEQFFQHINNLHPKTKFTMEKEENSTIPFLDILIQRNQDGTISVKVYRKPTHTNQYLSFTSHHSTRSKQSVVTALFNRAENVITNNTELKQEQQHITKVLQSNGHNKQLIDKTRRQWLLKQQNKNNNQPAEKEPEPVRRISLPYIQGISEQLQRTPSQHNIKSTFYTTTTLRKTLLSQKTLSQLRKSTTSSTSLIARTVMLYI